ncbi:uncharacterized protein N7443_009703, partial [Penicillium atrosanguineum]|uniref:uncharacterized protein n=1 Tax=Penicillium atrosanguineum TaxID=1132637 RepID=UPI002394502B
MSTTVHEDDSKLQRALSCVSCQRRKIKCDRDLPCANCITSSIQCVPATVTQRRRRRLPERVLLERLRHYEGILRQNRIEFEPLHPVASNHASEQGKDLAETSYASPKESAERQTSETVNLWHAISKVTLDTEHDGDHHSSPPNAWDHNGQKQSEGNDDHLFFDPRPNVEISTLHPDQAQIFCLWQIYLDNVNPLLKVTHTPTLQRRIIDAVVDLTNVNPTLEALMFSIYCAAMMSLEEATCQSTFGSPKKDLLAGYQFACQQGLAKCRVWQCTDLDGLTAWFLYLISVRPQSDPRSLSSTLAAVTRLAQRMGLHSESDNTRYSPLEADFRRRLWWALIVFDHRISEMSDYKTSLLIPTWDCQPPSNLNDSELRPEMKMMPKVYERPTEAIFAVLRSQLADFTRHSAFHLDFINPSLKAMARAKAHNTSIAMSSVPQTNTQRNEAASYALNMLECDTKLCTHPHIKGYMWLVNTYVPALATIHLVNDLTKRPAASHADRAWEVMSDNYEARTAASKPDGQSVFVVFARAVLQAWAAREAVLQRQNKPLNPPNMVVDIDHFWSTMDWRQMHLQG